MSDVGAPKHCKLYNWAIYSVAVAASELFVGFSHRTRADQSVDRDLSVPLVTCRSLLTKRFNLANCARVIVFDHFLDIVVVIVVNLLYLEPDRTFSRLHLSRFGISTIHGKYIVTYTL